MDKLQTDRSENESDPIHDWDHALARKEEASAELGACFDPNLDAARLCARHGILADDEFANALQWLPRSGYGNSHPCERYAALQRPFAPAFQDGIARFLALGRELAELELCCFDNALDLACIDWVGEERGVGLACIIRRAGTYDERSAPLEMSDKLAAALVRPLVAHIAAAGVSPRRDPARTVMFVRDALSGRVEMPEHVLNKAFDAAVERSPND